MKTITIDGKRYRIYRRSWSTRTFVSGNGIISWALPEGVTIDSPELRDNVRKVVVQNRENRKKASEYIQQRVREGKV